MTDNGTLAPTLTENLTIPVTAVNDNPPVFTANATPRVAENTAAFVGAGDLGGCRYHARA